MNDTRYCPNCKALSHYDHDSAHYYGCQTPQLPRDCWTVAPDLDPRPCIGHSQWRALHSVWVDTVVMMPTWVLERLPERLHHLTLAALMEAVLDGLVVVDFMDTTGHTPPYLALSIDIGDSIEVVRAPLEWLDVDPEAMRFEQRMRLDMALARMLDGGA